MPALRDLEQLRYWQGQLLRSRDFRDKDRIDAERRWWHNRSVHGEFGIRYGLHVTGDTSSGSLVIAVACGLAYDCFGRELILQSAQTAPPIPAGPDPLMLVLSYASAPETTVQLTWIRAADVRTGDGVPLAQIGFSGSAPSIDTTYRPPVARALTRPRLASGDTVHGNTPWEPWIETLAPVRGSAAPEIVGVQTHVDTSAAGFTSTPNYFATLQWPKLTPKNETFAAAYFPSIADASERGFTYRLLMKGIARRRLQVAFGVSEVQAGQSANPNDVPVTAASGFRVDDSVLRVVPQSLQMMTVDSAAGPVVTLHGPFQNLNEKDVLAIGNPPRTALVTTAPKGGDTAMVVTVPGTSAQPGDFLVRITGAAMDATSIALVTDVKGNAITLDTPIVGLTGGDQIGIARPAITFPVGQVKTELGVMSVTLEGASPFAANELAMRTTPGAALAASVIQKVAGNFLILKAPIDGLVDTDVLSEVSQTFTVSQVGSKKRAMQLTVDHPGQFRPGDFIARYDAGLATSLPVQIDTINGNTISLVTALDHLANKDTIGAANLKGTYRAGAVTQLGTRMGVTVETPEGFAVGDLVAKVGSTEPPVLIDDVTNNLVTLRSPINGLASGDLLVTARFPRATTITQIVPYGSFFFLVFDVPFALRAGDIVARLADLSGAAPADFTAVIFAIAGLALVSGVPGTFQKGDRIAPLGFRARAIVDTPPAAGSSKMTIDRAFEFREGDLIGPLTAYAETSRPRSIQKIAGNILSLSGPIDGVTVNDIIGPASLTATQNRLRFESTETLTRGDELQAAGLQTSVLLPVSGAMNVSLNDAVNNVLVITPTSGWQAFTVRPETLSVAAVFNPNFVSDFVSFAQQQSLYVCWLGCQSELQDPARCPGDVPNPDPCADGSQ